MYDNYSTGSSTSNVVNWTSPSNARHPYVAQPFMVSSTGSICDVRTWFHQATATGTASGEMTVSIFDSTSTPTMSAAAITVVDPATIQNLATLSAASSSFSFWIFSPCVAIQANKLYFIAFDGSYSDGGHQISQSIRSTGVVRRYWSQNAGVWTEAASSQELLVQAVGLTELSAFTSPNAADYGLIGTSTSMTQDFGFFGNMLRDVFAFLFVPSSNVLATFEEQRTDLIENRFPFAYFYNVKNMIINASSSANMFGSMAVNLPLVGTTTILS